jgi:hypothetical protein
MVANTISTWKKFSSNLRLIMPLTSFQHVLELTGTVY